MNDNMRIRPEKHVLEQGKIFNPRHHGQHYHVESKIDPNMPWTKSNRYKLKPENYQYGEGTGFLPGEYFPGIGE